MRDPYEVLGVARDATADQIRGAYRALAKTSHPDLHPGDRQAEERFKEASAAYELLSDEEEGAWEGCLSVPGLRGWVPRRVHLRYRGVDMEGRPFEREARGFHARVVQHECDHLDGILYPMRVRDFTRFGYTEVLDLGDVVAE